MSSKKNKLQNHFYGLSYFVFIFFLLNSCAIRQSPDGGLKDLIPPKILRSVPQNYSTNFSTKEIRIDFDEYIDLKELNKQLVISPLMKSDPEVSVKSKTLIIKLPDSLRQNTTYTMNFGDAIVDTHEGNPLVDFQYVFSTGPVLDSLQLSGELKMAENLKTENGMVVMIYNNLSDTVVYNTLPDYFAKTDSAGKFLIKNLKAGTYKLFALKDANANYKFDSKTEIIGFLTRPAVVPDSDTPSVRMFIEPDTLPQLLKAQFVNNGKAIIVFTAPVKNFELKLLPSVTTALSNLLIEKNPTDDTLFVYCTDTLADSLNAIIYNGEKLLDTIHVNLKSFSTSRGRGDLMKSSLDITSNLNAGVLEMPAHFIINFSVPLKNFSGNNMVLKKDTTAIITFTTDAVDSLQKSFVINFKPEENHSYSFLIPAKAVTDIFNRQNDSVTFNFRTREEREYANVNLTFNSSAQSFNYLVQLITETDVVIKEKTITRNQKVEFNYVLPGKYKIRIADDANKNGKWDSGNYWRKIQPENVFYYPDLITTRANWDVDLSWILK